jgi:cyanophycin synthetase
VPGDRPDALIEEAARTAARCFDRLIVREDEDLRGRRPGEVAALICRAARQAAPDKECRMVLAECQALRAALDEMEDGEVLFFFFEKQTEPHLDILQEYGARPAETVPPLPALAPV